MAEQRQDAQIRYATVAEEADRLLGTTIPAEGGRQFPTRAEFDQCLAFLARLSENPGWDFLRTREADRG